MSPLITTGMRTASFTARTRLQSAEPLKNWQRVRACTVRSCTPAASARRANSGGVEARLIPPQPHLQRDRDRYGADHRLHQRGGMVEIAHQGRARQLARHLARRAAHIDVDDVGAQLLGRPRALPHPARLAADKLYDERLAVGARSLAPRLEARRRQLLAGDHLGYDQTSPVAQRQPPERGVGDPRHGREQNGVGQRVRPDANLHRWRSLGTTACAFAHKLGMFSMCTSLEQTSAGSGHSQARTAGQSTLAGCPARARRLTGTIS